MNKILYIQLVFSVMLVLFASIYTVRLLFTGNIVISVFFGIMTFVAYNLMFIPSVIEIRDELKKK